MKRYLICLLCLTLLAGCFSTAATAAEPDPALGDITSAHAAKGSITIGLNGMTGQELVLAAFYSEGGQLLGLDLEIPAAGTKSVKLSADLKQEAYSAKIFLLSSVWLPLDDAITHLAIHDDEDNETPFIPLN